MAVGWETSVAALHEKRGCDLLHGCTMPNDTRTRQDYRRCLAPAALIGECLHGIDVFIYDPTRIGAGTIRVFGLAPFGQPQAFGKDDEYIIFSARRSTCMYRQQVSG